MEDIKQAYRDLGLEPFASKDLVEQRYDNALRKHRARTKQLNQGQALPQDDSFDFDHITTAYKTILDYETKKYTEAFEQEEYGKYKNMAGHARKVDHFWRYYKWHTIISIFLVIGLIYGINSFIDRQEEKRYLASLPPANITLSYLGNFYDTSEDTTMETTNQKFLQDFPEYERVISSLILVPDDPSMQYAYLQKAMVMLIAERPDIYITDEPMKDWTLPQDIYIDLETIEELAPYAATKYAVKGGIRNNDETFGEPHFFMIDLTESELGKNSPMAYNKLIVGIRADTQNLDAAVDFIKYYASTLP